jgi:hypothetical protein
VLLADALADVVLDTLRRADLRAPASTNAQPATLYADATPTAPAPPPPAPPAAGYITIRDTLHPWLTKQWPADLDPPAGWVAVASGGRVYGRPREGPARPSVGITPPLPSAAEALARLSAERAADRARARRQREEDRLTLARERTSPRVTPGATGPFRGRPPRAARPPRAPRAPRTPRTPRTPRPPRTSGTKATRWGAWCRPVRAECWFSQGPCIAVPLDGYIVPKGLPAMCQGSVNPDCSGCYSDGCSSPNAALLRPILALIPKSWRPAGTPATPPPSRSRGRLGPMARRFRELERIGTPGAPAPLPTPSAAGGARTCCICRTWPGWVLCTDCLHSPKCVCHSKCDAIPPGSGYGY